MERSRHQPRTSWSILAMLVALFIALLFAGVTLASKGGDSSAGYDGTAHKATGKPAAPASANLAPSDLCGAWTDAAPLPVNKTRALGVNFGNSIYVFGGRPDATTYTQDVYRYDLASDSWTLLPQQLPDQTTSNMAGGLLTFPEGQRIFMAGGNGPSSTITGRTLAFNPADRSFTLKATWPASPARIYAGYAVANNKLYIFGGANLGQTVVFADGWVYDPMADTWAQLPVSLSVARYFPATETMPDGLIYIAGGSVTINDEEQVFEKFNPATNTITTGPLMIYGSQLAHGYRVGGQFTVVGGVGINQDDTVQVYDPSTNSWSIGPAGPHGVAIYAKGYGLSGSIHVIGGVEIGGGTIPYNQKFTSGPCATTTATPVGTATPTPTICPMQPPWVAGPSHDPARELFQGALGSDNKFYVAGGQNYTGTLFYGDFARYNSTTNAWEQLPDMPVPAGQVSVGSTGGKVFVAGGCTPCADSGYAITTTLRIYDIASNIWSFGAPLPSPVEAAGGTALNGKFYVIGGDNHNPALRTTYIYDIASNAWSTGPQLPDLRGRTNTYATNAGGIVYVYGGVYYNPMGNYVTIDTLLSYAPGGSSWTDLGSANTGGRGNYGAVSPYTSNTLLITDGATSAYLPTASTHIYNITTNTFSPGPSLITARAGHAQGLLNDGRVIVFGGIYDTATLGDTNTSELLSQPALCTTATATRTSTSVSGTATRTSTSVSGTATRTATPCGITFTDVHPTDYFYTPVLYLACHGVISGYSDGTFRPYNNATRGQMAKIVVLAFGIAPYTPTTPTFRDVPATDTFYSYIEASAHAGIVSGYQCGSPGEPCPGLYFRQFNDVTRGQLSKIVVVAATQARGWTLINPPNATFTDVIPNSAFYTYVETAVCHGIISGYADGTFKPFNNTTRGQIAKIVYLAVTGTANCNPGGTPTPLAPSAKNQ